MPATTLMPSDDVPMRLPWAATEDFPLDATPRAAGWLTHLVVVLLVVSSALRLHRFPDRLYAVDPLLPLELSGQDVATLLVFVPVLVGARRSAARGSAAAVIVWVGTLLYAAYAYYFYVATAQFSDTYVMHVAITAAAVFAAVLLLLHVDSRALVARVARGPLPMAAGAWLIACGMVPIVVAAQSVVEATRSGIPLDRLTRAVFTIELTVAAPLLVAVGVSLLRRRPWACAPAGALLVLVTSTLTTTLVSIGVLALDRQPLLFPAIPAVVAATLVTGALAAGLLRRRGSG